jgi:hypothetical protein
MANIGDIFVAQWGYEQTNVDFYVVTKVSKSFITLLEVKQRIVGHANFMAEFVVPNVDEPKMQQCWDAERNEPTEELNILRRKIQPYFVDPRQEFVKLNDYTTARRWSGEPVMQTHYH